MEAKKLDGHVSESLKTETNTSGPALYRVGEKSPTDEPGPNLSSHRKPCLVLDYLDHHLGVHYQIFSQGTEELHITFW